MTAKTATLLLSLILWAMTISPAAATRITDTAQSKERKTLLVGVLHDPPYIIKNKNGQWSGLNIDIWKNIAMEQGLDYEFKDLSLQESLEALRDNRLDISIEAFYVVAERLKYMDYTFPFGSSRIAVATLPEKIRHPWWEAIQIFFSWGTAKIILGLCTVLCLLGFLFWVIERKSNPDHFGGGVIGGIGSGIYWVGSTLTSGVCFGVALKSLPARILGLVWMLVCALALSALIASLTTSLSSKRSMTEIIGNDTLRAMRLGAVKGGVESTVLENLGGNYVLYDDEEQALLAVTAGKIDGFFCDEITLHYYKDNEYRGEISVYPTKSKRFIFAFGLPKKSPLRLQIDSSLLSLMEKPDWTYILRRHGLEDNLEAISESPSKRGRE